MPRSSRELIEISSSPEPDVIIPPRRKPPSPRTKPAPSRTRQVIELTDSDSDSPAPIPRPKLKATTKNVGSSSQGLKLTATRGASLYRENNAMQIKAQKASGSNAGALFFAASDEENNPLLASGSSSTNNVLSPRRTAGSLPLKNASTANLNALPNDPPDAAAAFIQDFEADLNMGWDEMVPPIPTPPVIQAPYDPQLVMQEDIVEIPDLEPQPQPESAQADPNPESTYVANVLEIIPDVDPDHLLALVLKHMPESQHMTAERVLHILFEDPSYPKAQKNKGKKRLVDGVEDQEKDDATETPSKKVKIDYADKERPFNGGPDYSEVALEQLQTDYPFTPKPFLRSALARHNSLYVPTFLFLRKAEEDHRNGTAPLPYQRKSIPYSQNAKGKRKQLQDAEFDGERAWLVAEHINPQPAASGSLEEEDPEDGIECGCCFSSFSFDKMVQCPETHLFCSDCMTSYAENLLGSHNPDIKCMDQSGCKAEIPPSELKRFLPMKLLKLWERVKQRKEVQAAGLEGLEECPFCEWGVVIENPDEKLLRCGNEDECGIVSCRSCKKKDHLPKSCKEAEEDKHLDSQHAVEEAMTQALMRNCPKCKKPFIKEYGCNKMSCPNCSCLSCYVCRQEIKGYDHFNQAPGGQGTSSKSKCPLYDSTGSVETRHVEEVKQAAQAAMEKFKQNNPDAEENAIKVDIPTAPIRPAPPGAQQMGMFGYAQDPYGFQALQNNYRLAAQQARQRAEEERRVAQVAFDQAEAQVQNVQREIDQVEQELNVLRQTSLRNPQLEAYYRDKIVEVGERRGRIHILHYQYRTQVEVARQRLRIAQDQLDNANRVHNMAAPLPGIAAGGALLGVVPPLPHIQQHAQRARNMHQAFLDHYAPRQGR